jgi:RES domain-containing protein
LPKYILRELVVDSPEGKTFYRARIHKDRTRKDWFKPEEMGAPPPEKTKAGRGNVKDTPVLYLSSTDKTAIGEVRPWKNMAVALAEVKLKKSLRFIDLVNYKHVQSPFFEDDLYWKVWLGEIFYRLADELARPVTPTDKKFLYKPSQYLCGKINEYKYDGVIYPSNMGDGNNIIIFDQSNVEINSISYFKIEDIKYDKEKIKNDENLYEETPYDYYLSKSNLS